MSDLNIALLKRLCETPGISGREGKIAAIVRDELAPISDEVTVDPFGNVTGIHKGSGGPTVMLAAHTDEIGFLVSHIDDQGFLRVQAVGGFDVQVLPAQRVVVWDRSGTPHRGAFMISTKPAHLLDGIENTKIKTSDLFIDLGMTADAVNEIVEVGDQVTMDRTLEVVGDSVMSKSLDDRVGVYVMLEALRRAQGASAEIHAVATTQEEVGLRGARVAAFTSDPDISIAIDITLALDFPGMKPQEYVTQLGKGAGLKYFDSSVIPNPKLVDHFRDLAEANGIPYQYEFLPRGGTDAGATALARGGNAAFTLSIPTRYAHTVNEMARISDIQACVDLLAAFLNDAGSRSYAIVD
ncbi:MAG: M42 family metallopeptidase [Thermomicrobiales bacterium]|nr:M42 family metallopeptidase [Thermomicrobiales bacterium]